jgi:FkbM family methyltransferase
MRKIVLIACFAFLLSPLPFKREGTLPKQATLREEDKAAGLELWETALGPLWIPSPGRDVIRHLVWEQAVQRVYDHNQVHLRNGDVVIDCGAHIGAFTRTALRAGARLVVDIEPERSNLRALHRNFAREIEDGRVVVVSKGVWDSVGSIPLHISSVGDSHSAVIPQDSGRDESIQVTTLDALLSGLKLPSIDFIKMDIEGAELRALRGAEQILRRWQPRLAISAYHQKGDPAAICSIVWKACPDYLVSSKDLVRSYGGTEVPKVLFFFRRTPRPSPNNGQTSKSKG